MSTQSPSESKVIKDARPTNWVDRSAPPFLRPYLKLMRADRPIGVWLLLWPCWWSLAMASHAYEGSVLSLLGMYALFGVGAYVMRGAGCTINDIADRNIDGRVDRTALRPIPSGQVKLWQAIAFLVLQLLVGLVILLQFNWFTVELGAASLILVAIYPFAKRFTWWPQAFLGLTFNWGALLGWSAIHGSLSAAPITLYAGAFFWTLAYDTIYGHQDKEDDALAGVKSASRLLEEKTKPFLMISYGLAVALFIVAGVLAHMAWIFYPFLFLFAWHLAWQIRRVDIDNPVVCLAVFKSNRDAGAILFLAWFLGAIP
jgi:4-hydroxybenzoate polyprenyltransferase